MAVRKVEIIVSVDDASAIRKLDELGAKLGKLDKERIAPTITIEDARAKAALDRLQAQLAAMSDKATELRVSVDDRLALLELDKIGFQLDKLGAKTADPKVTIDGIASAIGQALALNAALDRLDKTYKPSFDLNTFQKVIADSHRAEASAMSAMSSAMRTDQRAQTFMRNLSTEVYKGLGGTTDGSNGGGIGGFFGGLLGRLFGGGGGGGGGGAAAAASAGGGGGGLAALLPGGGITAGIAAALALGPALIPFLLGGGIGGGAALLAGKMGVTGLSIIQADRAALAQARAALKGPGNNTASNRLALRQAQAALASAQSHYGAFLPFGHALNRVGHNAYGALVGALTSNAPGRFGGNHAFGNLIPHSSFLSGLTGIVDQFSHFLKTIGPGLGAMFRSTIPIISAFAKIFENLARALLPALTAAFKQLQPVLPILVQGFKYLSQGIAGFIRNLGPGMKSSAIIFKAAMLVVEGILQALGLAASYFAIAIVKTAEGIRAFARNVPRWFDKLRHEIAVIFDGIRHEIAHAWDMIFNNTFARIGRGNQDVINFNKRLSHEIAVIFDGIRHEIAHVWDMIWNNTVGRVERGISDVIHWFGTLPGKIQGILNKLPSILYNIGKSVLTGLLHGLESMGSTVLGWIGHFASSIAGALANVIPGGGAISGFLGAIGMAGGGVITEPIIGRGLRTGRPYTFGERGIHERVTPLGHGGGGGGDVYNVYVSGDFANPDATALRIAQVLRQYKQHHGHQPLGIA